MDYQACVTEAKSLIKRSKADQWRLAHLTWAQLEAGTSGTKWAADIGVDPSYVSRLYKMWQALPHLDDVNYGALPDFNEKYKEVSPSSAYQPRPATVEEKAAEVEKLIAEPEVAAKIRERQREQHAERPRPEPQTVDLLSIFNELGAARRALRAAFRHTVSADPSYDAKMQILEDLGDLETDTEQFRKFLTGIGVDEFIDQVMEGRA